YRTHAVRLTCSRRGRGRPPRPPRRRSPGRPPRTGSPPRGGGALMRIAYLRVSTADQSIASQRLAIEKALGEKPEREFVDEGISGRVMQREGLDACLNALRGGDELVVYSLSRLGRSSAEVIRLVQDLTRPVE